MKKICSQCGTCIVTCPTGSLNISLENINEFIKKDENNCINCRICTKVCPFYEFDNKKYDLEIFKKNRKTNYEKIFGIYSDIYIGYCTDKSIRRECSSGGLITTILIYLLQKGYIDGAIVTDLDENFEPYSKICKSKEDIIKSKGSKYVMSHTNLAIKDILNENNNKRYAFVGLPCQIQAMRKLENIMPKIKEKIVIYLGLMCSNSFGNNKMSSQELLLNVLNVELNEIKEMRYRGDGWPGKFKIILKNGNELSIKFNDYIRIIQLFMPISCLICNDSLAEFADISFGDAWLPNIRMTDSLGVSILISRSEKGNELIEELKLSNILYLEKTSEDSILISQKSNLYRKKSFFNLRLIMTKILGYRKPEWNLQMKMKNFGIRFYIKIQAIYLFQYIYIIMNEQNNIFTNNFLKVTNNIFKRYLRRKVEIVCGNK